MRRPPFSLRPASREDRSFVRSLAGDVFGHLGDYRATLVSWLEDPEAVSRVATLDNEPVGFAIAAPVGWPGAPARVDLVAVAVRAEHRRQGLGRTLVRAVLDVRPAGLHVAADNLAARALFEAEGFAYEPGDDLEYPDGRPALRMGRAAAR